MDMLELGVILFGGATFIVFHELIHFYTAKKMGYNCKIKIKLFKKFSPVIMVCSTGKVPTLRWIVVVAAPALVLIPCGLCLCLTGIYLLVFLGGFYVFASIFCFGCEFIFLKAQP